MRSCKYVSILCAALAVTLGAGLSNADIIVGGTATTNIITALNDLGEPFVNVSPDYPAPGSADIIIIGMDGGQAGPDYTAYLNGGGDVILTGGSSLQVYRDWADDYFTLTDTGGGWHTDGDYHELVAHPANDGMPNDYSFAEIGHTFHMLAFLAAPNTTLLANNDEPNNIHAFRDYDNLGSFNYMALDLGIRAGDQAGFITPWMEASLVAARIPEPATLSLLVLGGVAALRRRR